VEEDQKEMKANAMRTRNVLSKEKPGNFPAFHFLVPSKGVERVTQNRRLARWAKPNQGGQFCGLPLHTRLPHTIALIAVRLDASFSSSVLSLVFDNIINRAVRLAL